MTEIGYVIVAAMWLFIFIVAARAIEQLWSILVAKRTDRQFFKKIERYQDDFTATTVQHGTYVNQDKQPVDLDRVRRERRDRDKLPGW